MRFSLPTLILSFSTLSSATFYLSAQESTEFSVGQGKAIQWDTADFESNLDIYLGPEDANEDDLTAGTQIATNYPNSGTFTYVPKEGDDEKYGQKKKKIWGHDTKGKKGKKGGKSLIIIIIKNPAATVTPGLPPLTQPIPQLPTATLTQIMTRTSTIKTDVTATETVVSPPKQTAKVPELSSVIVPAPLPTKVVPPVVLPTTGRQPILVTGTGLPGTGVVVQPTSTGISPPIFAGGASGLNAKPVVAGGVLGLLVLGLL